MISVAQQPLASARRTTWLQVEHLYPLLALVVLAVFVGLVPLPPNDLWWHLRAGQLIAEQGRVPTTNLFSWSLPTDTPFVYGAWLGEWLFYQLYTVGGLALVIFARNLLVVTGFALMGLEAWYRSRSWKLVALALVLAEIMTFNNLTVRTQNWSWVPFALFLLILSRFVRGQWSGRVLLLLPPIMVFWVNAHGAFVLGIVLLGLFALGETLRCMVRQPHTLPWRKLGALYLAGVAVVLATVVNPQGLGIFGYVRDLMTDQPSQRLVMEWASPTPHGLANGTFFISILLLLAALAYGRRPSPTDLLVVCAFLWLAWSGQRYVVWFGMVAMPVLAQALVRAPKLQRTRKPQLPLANGLLAALLVVPVVVVQPWFVHTLPLPSAYRAQVLATPTPPLVAAETPVAAAKWLRTHPGGKLFNEMGYGSYLIWALPTQPVFIDPRVELYPFQQWQDYATLSDGHDLDELIPKYGIDRILLSRAHQKGLATTLAKTQDWQRVYQDQWAEVWEKGE